MKSLATIEEDVSGVLHECVHAVSEFEKNRKQGLKRMSEKNEKKTEESVKVEVKNEKVLPLKRKTTFTWHERS